MGLGLYWDIFSQISISVEVTPAGRESRASKDDGILNYSERNYPQFLSLVKVVGMRISVRES